MIPKNLLHHLASRLRVTSCQQTPITGGTINATYKIGTGNTSCFCKVNSSSNFPSLFTAESSSLALIASTNTIRTPRIIDCFEHEDHQLLLLEWIQPGTRIDKFWEDFGKSLAALHFSTADSYGLDEDNYMGSVPQKNSWSTSWVDFFIHQRLQPLAEKCLSKQLLTCKHVSQLQQIYTRLPLIFPEEKPSLLHGDLWSGNFMCDASSQPVLIDPAVYYGHRSVDLAMTTLFGGFSPLFYQSYNHHFPFPSNYEEQWSVCNLYPLLIHLLLFGSSYRPQIETTLAHFQ